MGTCVKGAIITIVNWVIRSIMRMFKTVLNKIKANNRDSKWLSFWLCCCLPFLNFYEYWSKYQCNLTIMHVINILCNYFSHNVKRLLFMETIGLMVLKNHIISFQEIYQELRDLVIFMVSIELLEW